MARFERLLASAVGAFLLVEAVVGECVRWLQVIVGLLLLGIVNAAQVRELVRRREDDV